ncbi:hypothetical protein M072_3233 [Bacteroides fragilis str. DS-208]|nr:hypothetical protein M072_3233 [Bacteroides fragilis str. DS-208]
MQVLDNGKKKILNGKYEKLDFKTIFYFLFLPYIFFKVH